MKKLIIFLVLVTFASLHSQNLDSLNKYTGWENKGDYTEQKLKIGPITYSKIFDNGKYLFTADSNKYFRIWDLESGKIVMMEQISHREQIVLMGDSLVVFGFPERLDINTFNIFTKVRKHIKTLMYPNLQGVVSHIGFVEQINGNFGNIIFLNYSSAGVLYYRGLTLVFDPINFNEIPSQSSQHVNIIFNNNKSYQLGEYIESHGKNGNLLISNKISLFDVNGNNLVTFQIDNKLNQLTKSFSLNGKSIYFKNDISSLIKYDILNKTSRTFSYSNNVCKIYPINDSIIIAPHINGTHLIAFNDRIGLTSEIQLNNENKEMVFHVDPQNELFYITNNFGEIRKYKYSMLNGIYAKFELDKKNIVANQQIKFTNKSHFQAQRYLWDFGDGETSTEKSPMHLFKTPGIFTISLTAFNEYGEDTYVLDSAVIVKPYYNLDFRADNYQGMEPLLIKLKVSTNFEPDSLKYILNNKEIKISNNELKLNKGEFKLELIAYKDSNQLSNIKYFDVFDGDSILYQRECFNFHYYQEPINNVLYNPNLNYLFENIDGEYAYSMNIDIRDGQLYSSKQELGILNNLGQKISSININFSKIFSYIDGGYIINNSDSKIKVFDKNLGFISEFEMPNDYKYYSYWGNSIFAINNKEIVVYNKYFEKLKSFNFSEFIANKYNDTIVSHFKKNDEQNKDFIIFLQGAKGLLVARFDKNYNMVFEKYLVNYVINNSFPINDSTIAIVEKTNGFLHLFDKNFTLTSIKMHNYKNFCYLKGGAFLNYNLEFKTNGDSLFNYQIIDIDSTLIYQGTEHLIGKFIKNEKNENKFNYFSLNNILILPLYHQLGYNTWTGLRLYFNMNKIQSFVEATKPYANFSLLPYPNPATTELLINTNAFELKSVVCYDMIGVGYQLDMIEKSQNYTVFDVEKLPLGVYMLVINAGNEIQNVKFVKE